MSLVPLPIRRKVHVPLRPGAWDFGSDLEERYIELSLTAIRAVPSDIEDSLTKLADLFNPMNGFQQLIFDTLPTRYFLAKLISEPIPDWKAGRARIRMMLVCADPFAYALAPTIVTGYNVSQSTAGLDIGLINTGLLDASSVASVYLDVTTGGTYTLDMVVEITMVSAFTGTVVLSTVGLPLTFTWSGTLAAGDVLQVDGLLQRVSQNGGLVMNGVQPGARWPQLLPNATNRVQVLGVPPASISQLKVTFTNRWL